jgi:hypothetical protein
MIWAMDWQEDASETDWECNGAFTTNRVDRHLALDINMGYSSGEFQK